MSLRLQGDANNSLANLASRTSSSSDNSVPEGIYIMKPEPLCGIYAKTERSVTQIENLKQEIRAFFQRSPYRVRSDLNEDGTRQIWRFELSEKISNTIPVMVGEILHNLRSPLDQILCAIAVHIAKIDENGVAFPRGRDKAEFETALERQKKLGMPVDALDLIAAAKPYKKNGDNLLWALLELNRRDKHRLGLIPINMPGAVVASYVCFWRGLPLVIGPKTGKHLVMEKPFTAEDLIETGKPLALYDARPGHILFGDAGTPGDTSLEFMTTTPGARFDSDFQPALDIAFSEIGIDGQPVAAVLDDMRHLVERILLTFERRFFPQ